MAKIDVRSGQVGFDDTVAPAVDSLSSDLKVDSEYRETLKDSFSKIFGAYKRQYAGVVKEYKSKQAHYTRSEWRKIKDENSKKRNAKRARNFESKRRRYI